MTEWVSGAEGRFRAPAGDAAFSPSAESGEGISICQKIASSLQLTSRRVWNLLDGTGSTHVSGPFQDLSSLHYHKGPPRVQGALG